MILRQACVVESALLHHPDVRVFLLITGMYIFPSYVRVTPPPHSLPSSFPGINTVDIMTLIHKLKNLSNLD